MESVKLRLKEVKGVLKDKGSFDDLPIEEVTSGTSKKDYLASWVRTRVGDEKLAAKIEASSTPEEAIRFLDKQFVDQRALLIDKSISITETEYAKLAFTKSPAEAIKSFPKEEQNIVLNKFGAQVMRQYDKFDWTDKKLLDAVKYAGYATTAEGVANFLSDRFVSDKELDSEYPNTVVLKRAPSFLSSWKTPLLSTLSSDAIRKEGWFVSHHEAGMSEQSSNYPFFLASPCKTDLVVTKGECYVFGYRYSNSPDEGPVAREGTIVDADKLTEEMSAQTGCLTKAALGITGIIEDTIYSGSFGSVDANLASGRQYSNALPCKPNPSTEYNPPFYYYNPPGSDKPIQVGCKIPCIQIDANSYKDKYTAGTTYNFCTYKPKEVNAYEAAAAYVMLATTILAPEAILAEAGVSATTAAVAVSGSRMIMAGGAAAAGTVERIQGKWPGEPGGEDAGILENTIDIIASTFGAVKEFGGWIIETVKNLPGIADDVEKGISDIYTGCIKS